ncbi:MAG: isocitrate/isopropylmalate family dehydrogenase, partial [Kiritimatiellae bacterium]|nr:isocitrate/isopropylmalate family dehydrogenase [Kiritimatiellia bacterium]
SMFECMGGSAPKYTGKNIINPIAAIAAGGMMLDTLGETEAAQTVDRAVTAALNSGKIQSLAAGRMGMGTSEVGDLVASLV